MGFMEFGAWVAGFPEEATGPGGEGFPLDGGLEDGLAFGEAGQDGWAGAARPLRSGSFIPPPPVTALSGSVIPQPPVTALASCSAIPQPPVTALASCSAIPPPPVTALASCSAIPPPPVTALDSCSAIPPPPSIAMPGAGGWPG